MSRRVAVVGSLLACFLPVVASAPAAATPVPVRVVQGERVAASPRSAPVQSFALNAPSFVPGPSCVGSSLCNSANAPLLADGAISGTTSATASVPAGTAASGGYLATYGSGGIAAETAGGVAAVALSAVGYGAFRYISTGSPTLPERPASTKLSTGITCWYRHSTGGTTPVYSLRSSGCGLSLDMSGTSTWPLSITWPRMEVAGSGETGTPGSVRVEYRCTAAQAWSLLGSSAAASTSYDRTITINSARPCSGSPESLRVVSTGPTGTPDYSYMSDVLPWPLSPSDPAWHRRYVQQTITCQRAGGDTFTITVDAPPKSGRLFPADGYDVLAGMCPDGSTLKRTASKLKTDGAADLDLGTFALPDPYRQSVTGSDPNNPCYEHPGTGNCKVTLAPVTGTGTVPDNWWENPGDYQCMYGGSVIPLEYCSIYMRENVTTDLGLVPVPKEDPQNPGEPLPNPELGSGAGAGGGGTGDPGEETFFQCLDWSLSNLFSGEVIYKAVACSLEWAFLPSEAAVASFVASVRSDWDSSGPVRTIASVSAALSASAGLGEVATECPKFDFPIAGHHQDLDFCAYGVGGASSSVRQLSTIAFGLLALFACVTLILGAFGIKSPFGGRGDES